MLWKGRLVCDNFFFLIFGLTLTLFDNVFFGGLHTTGSIMKKVLMLLLTLVVSISLFAQSEYDKYLRSANKALSEGRVDDAERQYTVYKKLTKKVDKDFESRLQSKKSGKDKTRSTSTNANIKTVTVNGVSFEMVWVEGGTFQMGSNDGNDNEKPVHSVTLDGYYIGKYEVTQALYQAVMGSNPSHFKGSYNPVDKVCWNDAHEFVKKLNKLTGMKFALPTEAQWEYAARGGGKCRDYSYSGGKKIDRVAWYCGNSNKGTHPVGQKKPNDLGIYDMTGNVWELCQDWYSENYYSQSPSRNPVNKKKSAYRIYRGGSWDGDAKHCELTRRAFHEPTFQNIRIGLRLVLLP